MKSIIFIYLLSCVFAINTNAQTMRMVMGIGGGNSQTVGQTFVGFSNGSPNKLWQGFWLPKNVTTSVSESPTFGNPPSLLSKVYPNPAFVDVNFKSTENISKIDIHSISGESVYSGSDVHLNLNNISSGTYIVKITHENGIVDFHRLFVTR